MCINMAIEQLKMDLKNTFIFVKELLLRWNGCRA